jgi:pimeloyl-ACP methyl ester carboxylesterase
MTTHFWFESGEYTLLAHADLPAERASRGLPIGLRIGLLIVPPFGWEDVCSYRPLRCLAGVLADRGIPVLRYDLPGTGDSSGSIVDSGLDSGLIDAWIRSIGDAAAQLRAIANVDDVAVLGIRLGGTLAAVAASRGEIQDLILWGSYSAGRSEMRELRAYAEMERWEYSNDHAPSQPIPGFEVGGFLITPETQRDIEALDLANFPALGPRRVLILSRDNLAADAKLVRAFESAGCDVRRETGSGFARMMAVPNEALPPESTALVIADFLTNQTAMTGAARSLADLRTPLGKGGLTNESTRESVYSIGDSMFGILSEPFLSQTRGPESESCLLLLNAGGVRHIGPNRMWVDVARRFGAKGLASLRFDLPGIGESDGEPCLDNPALYQESLVERVETAMDSLRRTHGFRRFTAIGLCAGAFWAFHAAIRNSQIRSVILLNPRLFFWDPEVDRRRMMRRGAKGLVNPSDWWRFLSGGVQTADLKRAARTVLSKSKDSMAGAFSRPQIPPKKMAEAWNRIVHNTTRVTLVFTEGEPLLREMEEERQMPPFTNHRIQLVRIPSSGHTFRPLWAQKIVNDLIDRELDFLVSDSHVRETRATRVLKTT